MILQAIFDELQKLKCPGLLHVENYTSISSDYIAYFRGGSFWICHTGLTLTVTTQWTSGDDFWDNHDQVFSMEDQHLITKLRAAIVKIVMASETTA